MSTTTHRIMLAAALAWSACGDDATGPRPDAAVALDARPDTDAADASTEPDAGPVDAGPIEPPATPAPPDWTCPDGWHALSPARAAHSVCSPWPETGPAACGPGGAQWPGTAGCVTVGSPCPDDGWPARIAPGGAVIFVREGAAPGGTGGRDDPLPAIADALAVATPGTLVAVAVGRYEEAPLVVPDDVTIQGACAAATLLLPRPGGTPGAMLDAGAGRVTLLDLTVEGPDDETDALWTGPTVSGGSLTATSIVVRHVAQLGFGAGTGSTLALREALVTDVRPGGMRGAGLAVGLLDASATVERLVAERTRGAAVYAAGRDGRIDVSDFVIRDVTPTARGQAGWGVSTELGAEATLHRGTVERASNAGLGTNGGRIVAELVALDQITARPRSAYGAAGLAALNGGRVELRQGWLRDCDTACAAEGGRVVLEDVVAWWSGAYAELGAPVGAYARNGGALEARRVILGRGLQLGFYFSLADARLEDVEVTDTEPSSLGIYGNGIVADAATTLHGARIRLTRTREVGLLANGRGTALTLSDLVVSEVQRRACADGGCEMASAGVSLGAYARASVEVDRFTLSDGAFLGVQVATGGSMDLTSGVVRGHPIGANVQTMGFELERITAHVRYEDNERDFDGTALPLPSIGPPP